MSADGPGGLWRVVRSIPPGKVATYGNVGQALDAPVSGLFVGRWMTGVPNGVPWWRVVARNGSLPIEKRDLNAARVQEERLTSEGVEFVDGRVDMGRFEFVP